MPSAQVSCLAIFNVTEKHAVCFLSTVSLFPQNLVSFLFAVIKVCGVKCVHIRLLHRLICTLSYDHANHFHQLVSLAQQTAMLLTHF